MALRGSKVEKPETLNQEPETTQEEVVTEETTTTTEVAVKEETKVAVVEPGKVPSVAQLANALPPEEYGNIFPRIKGAGAGLKSDNVQLGEYIDVQVLSHSPRWFVTPDSGPGDTEARKFCRASYDGKTIATQEGETLTIEEYADSVDGYEFKTSLYHDIYCIIFNSDKNPDDAAGLGIVQVSVSPTAVKQFKAFTMQTKLAVMRKQMLASHQNCIRISADPQSNDKGDYIIMKFGYVPLDVLENYEPVVE